MAETCSGSGSAALCGARSARSGVAGRAYDGYENSPMLLRIAVTLPVRSDTWQHFLHNVREHD